MEKIKKRLFLLLLNDSWQIRDFYNTFYKRESKHWYYSDHLLNEAVLSDVNYELYTNRRGKYHWGDFSPGGFVLCFPADFQY